MLTCVIKIRILGITRSTSETVRQLSEIPKASRFVASLPLANFMGYQEGVIFVVVFFFNKNVYTLRVVWKHPHI